MSQQFWNKLNVLAGYFAVAVVFALVALSAHLEIKDLDLWLHIKTGQVILQQHQVPSQDIFSCTIQGKDWVNHEWLFQVFVAKLHELGGFNALIDMQVIIVTITLLILMLALYRPDRQGLLVFGLLLTILIYQSRLTIRPDIFSILFLTIFLAVLMRSYTARGALVLLALVQVLWVNVHGFFFMGPLVVWLMLLGLLINDWFRHEKSPKGFLITAAWLLPLVCLVNPLGVKGAIYPLKVMLHLNNDASVFFKHIVELAPPITWNTIFTHTHVFYKLMIMASLYGFVINRRSIDVRVLLVWLFFLVFSLAALRNMVFMGIVGCWALMLNSVGHTTDQLLPIRFVDTRFKSISAIIIKIIFIGWMVNQCADIANNGYFDFDTYSRKTEFEGISKRNFPYKAVDFLVTNKIKGNFFNDFNSGAYLIGRAYPNIKVFIDGRTEVYGSAFFKEYQELWHKGNKKKFEEFITKNNITAAFLNSYNQDIPFKCLWMFSRMRGWRVVYFDDDALILLKEGPANEAAIKKFGLDMARYKVKKMDVKRLASKRVTPFPSVNRATTLYGLKLRYAAIEELKEAIHIAPDYPAAYALLGKIYLSLHQDQKAFEALRLALMYSPSDEKSRHLLAVSYERLKDYTQAKQQYERILENNGADKAAQLGLVRSMIAIGDKRLLEKRFLLARQVYHVALNEGKYLDALNYRIGLTYLKLGDKITARKYIDEGLKINPKHRGLLKLIKQTKD